MTALDRAIADPPRVPGIGTRSPVDGLSRRAVGPVDVLAQSVSAVAPSAAATTIPVLVASVAGSGATWSLLAAMALSFLVGRTVNQFVRRVAGTGSLYTYVSLGLGPVAGVVAGAALLLGYGFIAMFSLTGSGYYLDYLLSRFVPAAGDNALVTMVVVAVMGAAVFAVIAIGVRRSTRLTLLVEALSVAVIVVFIVALVLRAHPVDVSAIALGPTRPDDFAVGTALAVTAFVGFESASVLGVEARRPFATIPRAISWTVLVAGALYLVSAAAQQLGFAAMGADLGTSASPVNELATAYGMQWIGWLLDVGIAASFAACAIASTTALVRVLFTMGREGVLPRVLGRTSPRFRTPFVAGLLACAVLTVLPVIALALGIPTWSLMEAELVVAALGYIAAYAMTCFAAPVFLRRIGELTTRVAVVSVATGTMLALVLVTYLGVEAVSSRWPAVVLAVGVVAAVVVAFLVATRRRPWRRGASRAVYDVPVVADLLGASGPATGERSEAR
ncbi:APC family permease [Curtobacterium sp. ZW137]|uniref:APC family permease n=1 Tax=Curtobacterium sp. ZW137 TaxID=2485104 RepID=UPI000F4CD5B6|nr:APC family permease [Curtobacterium sp. ZW137]ROP63561.1 amino acid/polyamine/organocation transporter (APC superfamily) [Curtobacterium sp. ZW137]